MKFNRSTRRMFLQGSGGALVAMPFLTSLLPREAWAQTAPTTRRFISIRSSYEMGHNSSWLPNDGSSIYNLPQPTNVATGVNGHHNVRWQNLRDFAPTNSSVLAPLYGNLASPYLESMNILRGLDYIGGEVGHSWAVKFGGIESGHPPELKRLQTLDHIINANKTFNPLGRQAALLGLTGASSQIKLASGTIANAPHYDRFFSTIYNGLFSNGSFPESGQTTLINPKGDVLNRVIGDYNRINNSKNISAADKLILQNTMDKFSDVQKSLVATTVNSCQYKTFYNTSPYKGSAMWDHTVKEAYKFLADLMALSIICDTARTFSVHNYLHEGVHDGVAFDHQVTSHETFGVVGGKTNWQRMNQRQKLTFDQLTIPLVKNLSEAVDPSNGKSYLYNSLIYHTTESGQVHGSGSQPAVLFGNAGGNITSGKYIDYSDRSKGAFEGADLYNKTPGSPQFSNNWRGVQYNRLLVTIMQAMGVSPSEYEDNAINQHVLNRTDYGSLNSNISSPIGGYGHVWLENPVVGRWDYNEMIGNISSYDLKQYKYKLPIL